MRELSLSATGVRLVALCTAEGAVLMGCARAQNAAEIARLDEVQELQLRQGRLHKRAIADGVIVTPILIALKGQLRKTMMGDFASPGDLSGFLASLCGG